MDIRLGKGVRIIRCCIGRSSDDSVSTADALKLANEARENLGADPLEEGFDG